MFTEEFKVRFYETDTLGHVNNTVMPGWFEAAREPIFKMFTPELDVKNWPLILASYKIDFLLPVFYGKTATVKTMISRIGGASFDVYQEAWQLDKLVSTGLTTMVHFDYKINKSAPITEQVRVELMKHITDIE